MTKCNICKKTYWYDSTEKCTYCDGTTFIGWRRCTHCNNGSISVSKPCPVCNAKGDLENRRVVIR